MGLIFLCIRIGLYFANKRKYFVCTQAVIATIIDIQKETINNSSSTEYEAKIASWFPIYEYVINGITIRKKAFVGTAKPEVTVGEKVSIFPDCHSIRKKAVKKDVAAKDLAETIEIYWVLLNTRLI